MGARILILSNLSEVVQALEGHYFQGRIPLITVPHSLLPSEWNSVSALIIIEPFVINNMYCSVSSLWKRYLSMHSPEIKLILMGFLDFQSTNYVDLLRLPKDFSRVIQNALPVCANYPVPVDGLDCHATIAQFFKGHGKKSLISQLNKIQQSLNIAYSGLRGSNTDFKEIRDSLLLPYFMPEWKELKRRWDVYFSFFEYLPFLSVMESIDDTFKLMEQALSTNDISENVFLEGSFEDKIIDVRKQLVQIDRLYVRPELYHE